MKTRDIVSFTMIALALVVGIAQAQQSDVPAGLNGHFQSDGGYVVALGDNTWTAALLFKGDGESWRDLLEVPGNQYLRDPARFECRGSQAGPVLPCTPNYTGVWVRLLVRNGEVIYGLSEADLPVLEGAVVIAPPPPPAECECTGWFGWPWWLWVILAMALGGLLARLIWGQENWDNRRERWAGGVSSVKPRRPTPPPSGGSSGASRVVPRPAPTDPSPARPTPSVPERPVAPAPDSAPPPVGMDPEPGSVSGGDRHVSSKTDKSALTEADLQAARAEGEVRALERVVRLQAEMLHRATPPTGD